MSKSDPTADSHRHPSRTLRAAVAPVAERLERRAMFSSSAWESQYRIDPWETDKLTAFDVVGPDGIVYPDFTRAGVMGGIPDVNDGTIRAQYTVYSITSYGAVANDSLNDDAAFASAVSAAKTNASSGGKSIVYIPAGTWNVTNGYDIDRSNVVIDGDGRTSTVVKIGTGGGGNALFRFLGGADGNLTNAVGPIARGATSVVVNSANGYNVGDFLSVRVKQFPAGNSLRERYSIPEKGLNYGNPEYFPGRQFTARVVAIENVPLSTRKRIVLDRGAPHEFFSDEVIEVSKRNAVQYSGAQDMKIDTASGVGFQPTNFERAINSWLKNVHVYRTNNQPNAMNDAAHIEYRDVHFDGTYASISGGGNAYMGFWSWSGIQYGLMDGILANDLRHVPIFQGANTSVVRNSTFTGLGSSISVHGRFPMANLVEQITVNNEADQIMTSDPSHTLRHGPSGPAFTIYNSTFRGTEQSGAIKLMGANAESIFVYNQAIRNREWWEEPSLYVTDRSFKGILRGNVFQTDQEAPMAIFQDPTSYGWRLEDNRVYGSNNNRIWEGDGKPEKVDNNRFFPFSSTLPATTPEAASIFNWQKQYANTPRLLVMIDKGNVNENGTVSARIIRVKTDNAAALTVNLSDDSAALGFPASVTIPAGQAYVDVTLTAAAVTTPETVVTVTASAAGLMSDSDTVSVLDAAHGINFGVENRYVASPLGNNWKSGDFGQTNVTGSESFNASTGAYTLSGAGINMASGGKWVHGGKRFLYKSISGNGSITVKVTGATAASQVGIAILDDEAQVTEHMTLLASGQLFGSGNSWDGQAKVNQYAGAGTVAYPVWLRLTRTGNVFKAEKSADGTSWTTISTIDYYANPNAGGANADYLSTATLDPVMHFGLLVNSNSKTTVATATFTDVSITGTVVPPTTDAPVGMGRNLQASVATPSRIDLSWIDGSSNEAGWKVERRTSTSGVWSQIAIAPSNATSYQDSTVAANTTYFYRVRPYTLRADGEFTGPNPPGATTPAADGSYYFGASRGVSWIGTAGGYQGRTGDLAFDTSTATHAEVQTNGAWTGLDLKTGHRITKLRYYPRTNQGALLVDGKFQASNTADFSSGVVDLHTVTTAPANATWTDVTITNTTEYRYVRFIAAPTKQLQVMELEFYGVPQGVPVDTTPPAVPAGLTAAAGNTQISLDWSNNTETDLAGYNVYRSASSGGTYTKLNSSLLTGSAYTDTGLTNGTTYFYKVTAVDASGNESAQSSFTSATPVNPAPAAPSGLAASASSSSQINLTWTDNSSDETGFTIERATDAGFTANVVSSTVGAGSTSLSVTGLAASTTYYFRVKATKTGAADSAWSGGANATTLAASSGVGIFTASQDVGAVAAAGSASESGGTYTVSGSGADIEGTADEFRFVHRTLTGDGEIVARITSLQNTNAWAKAGIMFRDGTTANAVNAALVVTPTNGVSFQRRTTAGGGTTATLVSAVAAPLWLKLVRQGNSFSAFRSADSFTWTPVGTAQTITMGASVSVGLAVTSHADGTLNSATFTNVSVGVPPLLSESFDSTAVGALPSGWTAASGSWSVQSVGGSNRLRRTDSAGAGLITTGSATWADYSVEALITPDANSNGASLLGRVQGSNKFYQLELKNSSGTKQVALWKNNNGVWNQVGAWNFNWTAGNAYRLRLSMVGTSFTASHSTDGGGSWATIGSATDAAAWTTGSIGFRTDAMTASVDDVIVRQM